MSSSFWWNAEDFNNVRSLRSVRKILSRAFFFALFSRTRLSYRLSSSTIHARTTFKSMSIVEMRAQATMTWSRRGMNSTFRYTFFVPLFPRSKFSSFWLLFVCGDGRPGQDASLTHVHVMQ